jgi:hypothetical protein
MKPVSFLKILWIVMIVVSLAGCNYPGAAPAVPQETPTTLPPSPTLPPPTEPPTPIPPTQAPTLPPPTATLAPPTAVPATPTSRPSPTQAEIKPVAGARFEGTFEGGSVVLRINSNGSAVIPKTVRIQKATCQEGKILSDILSFEPPPSFPIEDGKFAISYDNPYLYWTGTFLTPTQARGSIELRFKKEGVSCTIGPVAWMANAVDVTSP